jgi:hypothetical protein
MKYFTSRAMQLFHSHLRIPISIVGFVSGRIVKQIIIAALRVDEAKLILAKLLVDLQVQVEGGVLACSREDEASQFGLRI